VPIATGFLFGPWFCRRPVMGATISAIMLAIFAATRARVGQRQKVYRNRRHPGPGQGFGSPCLPASSAIPSATRSRIRRPVSGYPDQIMSTVSLITVAVFNRYNLLDWIMSLVK
jgi:K(+)-stimulated pyrophosphate-energized sodium pump